MYQRKNYKPLSKRHHVKSKSVKPMDTNKSIIDRYKEPILPERTTYKFKESEVFETKKTKSKTK
tara:strand:- start:1321 stop:1512 length:192 start_codon:yes stop_codon:yes gene_type:complete